MFPVDLTTVHSVLCLGCHADDIEIGCGGTLLTALRNNPDLEVNWVVWSAAGPRKDEATASAEAFLAGCTKPRIHIEAFRDAFFPADWEAIKTRCAEIARDMRPDVVFTHRRDDRHQDHRVIAELTWNAFRDHVILEYEIPKYEGDLGQPNVYVPIDESLARKKFELLQQFFPTQARKDWFTESTFQALMRIRGLECRAPSGFAEAFHASKLVANV